MNIKCRLFYIHPVERDRDLVNKPVQSILLCKSSLLILFKVQVATGFRRELVSFSMQISTILAGFE